MVAVDILFGLWYSETIRRGVQWLIFSFFHRLHCKRLLGKELRSADRVTHLSDRENRMKKRNIVILLGYSVHLIFALTMWIADIYMDGWYWPRNGLVLILVYAMSLPFVTGILSLLDFGTSFLPSMRYGTVWRCLFGSFGMLTLLLYADAFWWHPLTEFHTHVGVVLTLAIWVCWIVRFVSDRRKNCNQTVAEGEIQ